jgi:hypothetical protein
MRFLWLFKCWLKDLFFDVSVQLKFSLDLFKHTQSRLAASGFQAFEELFNFPVIGFE